MSGTDSGVSSNKIGLFSGVFGASDFVTGFSSLDITESFFGAARGFIGSKAGGFTSSAFLAALAAASYASISASSLSLCSSASLNFSLRLASLALAFASASTLNFASASSLAFSFFSYSSLIRSYSYLIAKFLSYCSLTFAFACSIVAVAALATFQREDRPTPEPYDDQVDAGGSGIFYYCFGAEGTLGSSSITS